MSISEGALLPFKSNLQQEGLQLIIDGQTLIIAACYADLTAKELKSWKKRKVKYGVLTRERVPFFLMAFEGSFDFNFSLDLGQDSTPEQLEQIKGISDSVTLLLCDYPSTIIKAIRIITVDPKIMAEFKEKSLAAYTALKGSFKLEATRIQRQYSNQQMMQQAVMRSSKISH